jgi:hypothetical protein
MHETFQVRRMIVAPKIKRPRTSIFLFGEPARGLAKNSRNGNERMAGWFRF